jgi:Spy/CpxP family protein refolding chaperone
MRKTIRFLSTGLLAALLIPCVWAQGGLKEMPPGKWWTNKRLISALKLSPDQQSRIDAVWTQHRRGLIDRKAELEKRQLDLADLLGKDSIDEDAALKAFDRVQEARAALERATFIMRIQIKNLLSPEQQQRLESFSGMLRPQRGKLPFPPAQAPPAAAAKK